MLSKKHFSKESDKSTFSPCNWHGIIYLTLLNISFHIAEAISALENVAEHINEMQNITEKFLPIFQELANVTSGLSVSTVGQSQACRVAILSVGGQGV